jgi:hypothetical protein
MLFRERVAVYCENHTEHTDTLCGRKADFSMLKQVAYRELVFKRLILWHNGWKTEQRSEKRQPVLGNSRKTHTCIHKHAGHHKTITRLHVKQPYRGCWKRCFLYIHPEAIYVIRTNGTSQSVDWGHYFSRSHQPPEFHLTLNGRNIPFVNSVKYLGVIYRTKFSAPFETFQGSHWFAICTLLSNFRIYMIIYQNYAGNKQESYKIIKMQMLSTLDKANPDTGGLNLMTVKHTTVQVTKLPL